MDKTKKYTLIFVVVCFLLIGGVGIYQMYVPASSHNNEISVTDQKKTQEESELKKEDSEKSSESKNSDSRNQTTNTQKKENSSSKETNKPTKQETQKKTESNSSTQPEKKEETETSIQVGLVIQGVDSIIVNEQVKIEQGKTVYDVLKKVTQEKGIELRSNGPAAIVYIKGINGLNEFDHGASSGWKYKINNTFPSKSAGSYKVENGDQIEWIYTTNG